MNINFKYRSPNFNERIPGTNIEYIVMHYTACDFKTSLQCLTEERDKNPVSAHYLVDLDGSIYNLVADEMCAWHAGVSFWQGRAQMNSWSVGIEIVNLGPGHDFPDQQMHAVKDLSIDIMKRHKIKRQNVIAHSDIAPGRKIDPGERFDWKCLAEHGVGVFPKYTESMCNDNLLNILEKIGYSCERPQDAIDAFKLHFCPYEQDQKVISSIACSVLKLMRAS